MNDEQMQAFKEKANEMKAECRERQKTCRHLEYSYLKHGRCCHACGMVLTDFGD